MTHNLTSCLCSQCCSRRAVLALREMGWPLDSTAPEPPDVTLDIEVRCAYQWGYVSGQVSGWLPGLRANLKRELREAAKWQALESFERGFSAGFEHEVRPLDVAIGASFNAHLRDFCGCEPPRKNYETPTKRSQRRPRKS